MKSWVLTGFILISMLSVDKKAIILPAKHYFEIYQSPITVSKYDVALSARLALMEIFPI